jgi:hypothetical protein
MRDQVSHPYKTTSEVVVLCSFWRRWKVRRFCRFIDVGSVKYADEAIL